MAGFKYADEYKYLLTPEIVGYLCYIHDCKGQKDSPIDKVMKTKKVRSILIDEAKYQSMESSNRMEGISIKDHQLKKLVDDSRRPREKTESKIAGYRDIWTRINEDYQYMPLTPETILDIHKQLFQYCGFPVGGRFRKTEKGNRDEFSDRNELLRFDPVSSDKIMEFVTDICNTYNRSVDEGADPLFLIPFFVRDFLMIRPFSDGNGRMSRLILLLLLNRSGYTVGYYASVEKIIEDSQETYYSVFSSFTRNDPVNMQGNVHFFQYFLGVIVQAYDHLSARVDSLTAQKTVKIDRVREIIKNQCGCITSEQLFNLCPKISVTTVQRTLKMLIESKEITKIGGGRYTSYKWNGEK